LETVVALALVFAATIQAAGREGTVTGTLVLNGRSVTLAHVYATAEPGFFDKTAEDIHILLSDVPLADAARADEIDLMKMGRDGRATIVEVVIDSDGDPISGAFYAREFGGLVSASGMHVFVPAERTRTLISGRLRTQETHTFAAVSYSYDATFTAPIPRPPTADELAAALGSQPALAAGRFVASVKAGSLADFLAILAPALAASFQGPDGASRFHDLQGDLPPDARPAAVVPQADGTVLVTVEGHAGDLVVTYTLRMAGGGERWRVESW